jgi:anti-anti-sigma factor
MLRRLGNQLEASGRELDWMERHHMKMAVGVITGSDGDALADGVVAGTHTVFDNQRHAPAVPADALGPRKVPGRIHTLVLTGSLDRGSAHQLEAEIERLCEEGVAGITLDLRQLAHIEAIGVAVVAFRCRLCRRRGYEFALIRGSRAVQLAFERAGLGERLPFVHDRKPLGQRAAVRNETAEVHAAEEHIHRRRRVAGEAVAAAGGAAFEGRRGRGA